MNTTENNKSETNRLIAEFMEHKPKFEVYIDDVLTTLERPIKNYHSDWNWLMEVVDKIYEMDLYYDRYIDYNSSMISDGKINLGTRINRVYEQVVEFIKWYNEQNK